MQKITPSLWFDKNAEEAMNFYTATFKNSKINRIDRYPEGYAEGPLAGMEGMVINGEFELEGQKFICLDGGPIFKFNPSVSFHVKCTTTEEVDQLWSKLSEGGEVLMPLGQYPFSQRYGWCSDKYGLSWQVILVNGEPIGSKFTPVLMFVGELSGRAEEAINFYTSVFHNSSSEIMARYARGEEPDVEGTVKYASFTLEGQEFGAMDSAQQHNFNFNEAISFTVNCEDQEEVDYYWNKLSAVPKSEQCGWCKDQFGVSWQIIPKRLGELLTTPDKDANRRVMDAMLKMHKIEVADLEKAANGE